MLPSGATGYMRAMQTKVEALKLVRWSGGWEARSPLC